MPVTGVKVAVRIRPLNSREKDMKSKVCVDTPTANRVVIFDLMVIRRHTRSFTIMRTGHWMVGMKKLLRTLSIET